MFGVGDFWLEIRVIIKILSHPSKNFFLLHPHENQSKVLGYQGWDKILMIILVSSQKSPTPNISAASVCYVAATS